MGPNGQFIKDNYSAGHDRLLLGLWFTMAALAVNGYGAYVSKFITGQSSDFSTHLASNVVLLPFALLGVGLVVAQAGKMIATHNVRKAVRDLEVTGAFANEARASRGADLIGGHTVSVEYKKSSPSVLTN